MQIAVWKPTLSALVCTAVLTLPASAEGDDQFDPTVDYRSLKEEYAAEARGAVYGDKRRYYRTKKGKIRRHKPQRRRNFSASRRRH
ncbi:MAG: hypothetical protein AAF441_12165 [Pseudomonadota bacterium]